MINQWIRITGRGPMPAFTRYRTVDGWYGLRIRCWHDAVGDLVYPYRETMENWEWYASLNPCRWVEACPRFKELQDPERSRQSATEGFVDMVPPERRTVKAERDRRRGVVTRG